MSIAFWIPLKKEDVLILQNEINGIEDILEKAYARGISIVLNHRRLKIAF